MAVTEAIGVMWLETFGAYLVGRCFVRTVDDFLLLVKTLLFLAIFVFPFALYELLTGKNLIISLFHVFGPTIANHTDIQPRMGLDRVQGPFDHPILFGVFFGSMLSLVYYVTGYGAPAVKRVFSGAFVAICGSFALSTGPLIAITTQFYTIIWDNLFHNIRFRWAILFSLFVVAFIVIDVLSNRTPFHVIVTYLSFSSSSAYNRILIWTYGYQNIIDNPLFGIGLGDWARPHWMPSSIDMFWIVSAIRYGVAAWALHLSTFFFIFLPVLFRKIRSKRVAHYRTGYLLTLVGLFVAGWAVHYWNSVFAYFMFLLGSGIWFLDYPEAEEEDSVPPDTPASAPYSRFSQRPTVGSNT